MINITLKDNAVLQAASGTTVYDIAKQISPSLARNALAGLLNGKAVDLTTPIEKDSTLEILTFDDARGKEFLAYFLTRLGTSSETTLSRCTNRNRPCHRKRFLLRL